MQCLPLKQREGLLTPCYNSIASSSSVFLSCSTNPPCLQQPSEPFCITPHRDEGNPHKLNDACAACCALSDSFMLLVQDSCVFCRLPWNFNRQTYQLENGKDLCSNNHHWYPYSLPLKHIAFPHWIHCSKVFILLSLECLRQSLTFVKLCYHLKTS